jgi:hypothetical protein
MLSSVNRYHHPKVLACEIVEKWSKFYERGLKQLYNDKETISLKLWKSGNQWTKSNKSILSTEYDTSVQYYIPVDEKLLWHQSCPKATPIHLRKLKQKL